jgi:hypothetical protein
MNDLDILVELYKEQRALGTHHEQQRATVSGLMLTGATILVALTTFDDHLTLRDLPLALSIILLGIFGVFFSLKDYERFRFHRHRSRLLRDAIDAALAVAETNDASACAIREEVRKALKLEQTESSFLLQSMVKIANKRYKKTISSEIRLHTFRAVLHGFAAVVGIVIFILILY